MTTHNANNERVKREYFTYLKEAKRYSEPTVDACAKALDRFEGYTRYRDFKAFHFEQAIAFKNHLAEQNGQRSGRSSARRPYMRRSRNSNDSSNGLRGNRATNRVFNIPMPSISICPTRMRALLPPSGNRRCRHWNRSSTSSIRCRTAGKSGDVIAPSSRSPS